MGLQSHAHLVFPELKQPQLIEVLPSVTYSSTNFGRRRIIG